MCTRVYYCVLAGAWWYELACMGISMGTSVCWRLLVYVPVHTRCVLGVWVLARLHVGTGVYTSVCASAR